MGKKSIVLWGVILVVIALCFGGYFFLAKGELTDRAWNPLSKECNFKMNISKKSQQEIFEIVDTVANTGSLSLLGKKGHLDRLGAIVDKEVETLDFWGYIMSQPKLAKDMKKIQGSSMKYDHFVENSGKGFRKAFQQNKCFYNQAKGFAKYLKINEERTLELMKECMEKPRSDKDAFKPFIDYLIKEKAK